MGAFRFRVLGHDPLGNLLSFRLEIGRGVAAPTPKSPPSLAFPISNLTLPVLNTIKTSKKNKDIYHEIN